MITEDTVKIGGKYRAIKQPRGFGEVAFLIGKIGAAKWSNYRGICLKFPDNSGYVIPFDCLESVEETKKNTFRAIPTANTAIYGQYRYRFAQMPEGDISIKLLGRLGQFCEILWTDRGSGSCAVTFENGDTATISLTRLEDIGT